MKRRHSTHSYKGHQYDFENFYHGSGTGLAARVLARRRQQDLGKGFDCFKEDAIANLGVSDWHGREAIRKNAPRGADRALLALGLGIDKVLGDIPMPEDWE